ncbi:MAG: hypothetical protein GXY83_32700 [Rhodopirellula sp.]|nr:hypothetical protein [Rhodopirellula sp.]
MRIVPPYEAAGYLSPGLDPAYAKFLQETAHQAVTNEVQMRVAAPRSQRPSDHVPVLKP